MTLFTSKTRQPITFYPSFQSKIIHSNQNHNKIYHTKHNCCTKLADNQYEPLLANPVKNSGQPFISVDEPKNSGVVGGLSYKYLVKLLHSMHVYNSKDK